MCAFYCLANSFFFATLPFRLNLRRKKFKFHPRVIALQHYSTFPWLAFINLTKSIYPSHHLWSKKRFQPPPVTVLLHFTFCRQNTLGGKSVVMNVINMTWEHCLMDAREISLRLHHSTKDLRRNLRSFNRVSVRIYTLKEITRKRIVESCCGR
jgi:hypothetical protein